MTPQQVSLFDAPATRGASRTDGPATSRSAARSLSGPVLRHQQRCVLEAVDWLGTATAWDVHNRILSLTQQNVIAKRLGELRDLGMVRLTGVTRPGSSNRMQQVHAITEAGREALT